MSFSNDFFSSKTVLKLSMESRGCFRKFLQLKNRSALSSSLIGWVCVSNKFLSILAKVLMLEWPGSDVDRAQRLMDQGSEALTSFFFFLFFFLVAEGASVSFRQAFDF